eukprot:CAMPEP_0119060346 /NCGR_PEP_ID=MMETSP1178-20130426/4324_1 /TAXON_ID=33656 /ORGANISM="unid sp, Strain CCMP2000" /LENGTH=92 /DNA_ID=CAMNT_0007041443 /DNA_START=62 /DNA_END=336 /DNA_ORIENTATION=+
MATTTAIEPITVTRSSGGSGVLFAALPCLDSSAGLAGFFLTSVGEKGGVTCTWILVVAAAARTASRIVPTVKQRRGGEQPRREARHCRVGEE